MLMKADEANVRLAGTDLPWLSTWLQGRWGHQARHMSVQQHGILETFTKFLQNF